MIMYQVKAVDSHNNTTILHETVNAGEAYELEAWESIHNPNHHVFMSTENLNDDSSRGREEG